MENRAHVLSPMVSAFLTGIFPRSEELIEATRAFERRRIALSDLEAVRRRDADSVIKSQTRLGFGSITDGQLSWQDLLRPFVEAFTGLTLGPLTRWFDNNTFYRKPIVQEKVRAGRISVGNFAYVELLPQGVKWRAILPSPYAFSKLVENRYYRRGRDLALDIADGLRDIAEELLRAGFREIQLSEPCLCSLGSEADELEVAREAVRLVTRGLSAETTLQSYFGSISRIWPDLLDFPVDRIGVDFYANSLDELDAYSVTKGIACGCVDARNSLAESPKEIAVFATQVRDHLNPPDLSICPNCDLEYLPRAVAENKLQNIARAVELVQNS